MKFIDLFNLLLIEPKNDVANLTAFQLGDAVYLTALDGSPTLLIAESDQYKLSENYQLKYLDIHTITECNVSVSGRHIKSNFIVIKLNSTDSQLSEWFLTLFESFSSSIISGITSIEFNIIINKFISIFSKIDTLPKITVIGMIGELLLINISDSPDNLVDAWHVSAKSRIDFSSNEFRIEVKTTTQSRRIHRFKYSQIRQVDNVEIFIASFLIDIVDDGKSLISIISEVRNKLTKSSTIIKFTELCAEILGRDMVSAEKITFDYESAFKSFKIFLNCDIPTPIFQSIPGEVSNISFDVDLTNHVGLPVTHKIFNLFNLYNDI